MGLRKISGAADCSLPAGRRGACKAGAAGYRTQLRVPCLPLFSLPVRTALIRLSTFLSILSCSMRALPPTHHSDAWRLAKALQPATKLEERRGILAKLSSAASATASPTEWTGILREVFEYIPLLLSEDSLEATYASRHLREVSCSSASSWPPFCMLWFRFGTPSRFDLTTYSMRCPTMQLNFSRLSASPVNSTPA